MKIIVKISQDYNSDLAYENKIEDINYLVNELNVCCKVKNSDYNNLIEQQKRYQSNKEDYSDKMYISAKGYSQSEWQEYILYYNEQDLNTPQQRTYFDSLVEHLKRSFTHNNNYIAEKYEQTVINGKIFNSDAHDYDNFCIDTIEFPDSQDIIEEYNSIYGIDYDEILTEC